MKIQDVQIIRLKPFETGLKRLHDPFARLPGLIRPRSRRCRKPEFACQDPMIAVVGNALSNNLFRASGVINIRRIDEIDALFAGFGDDAQCGCSIGRAAKHHCAQT